MCGQMRSTGSNSATNIIKSVMVPGAAAPAGINTIKSLNLANYKGRIIATDSSNLAAGFFMATSHEVMPEVFKEEEYRKRLFEVVQKYGVQVLMPSSGFDIYEYSKYRQELQEEYGAVAVVSDPKSLEICRDKALTFETLDGKFDTPFTTRDPNKVKSFPVIAKPRLGKGSEDIFKLDDEKDLAYVTSKFEEDTMIFQEYLAGQEYTIDVLCDLDKKPLLAVPRIRVKTRGGISTVGTIKRDKKIESECLRIAKHIGIRGPCCMQMKEISKEDPTPRLIEINPRMGGGTIFSTLAGANFPSMILEMVAGARKLELPKISEITVARFFEEIIIKEPASQNEPNKLLMLTD
jgi:carbamoyl-phosphate synthase large subunit